MVRKDYTEETVSDVAFIVLSYSQHQEKTSVAMVLLKSSHSVHRSQSLLPFYATKRKVSKNNVKYPYIKNKVTTIDIIYEYYVYGHNSQVVK